jgi:serine/threonine protein kinase
MEYFKDVTTFEELTDLNIKHLEKKINWVPYHQKKFEGTIDPLLINLNESGFLTITGQCYYSGNNIDKKLYIGGYIKVGSFNKPSDLEYFIQLPGNKIDTNISDWECAYNSVENHVVCFNPLVKKNDKTIIGLPFRDLNYINDLAWGSFENIKQILSKGYCYIHIQSKNNDPLFYTKILSHLKQKTEFGKMVKLGLGTKDIPFEDINKRIEWYHLIKAELQSNNYDLEKYNPLKTLKEGVISNYEESFIIKKTEMNTLELTILEKTTNQALNHKWINMPIMYGYKCNEQHCLLFCEKADTTLWDFFKKKHTDIIINNIIKQCFLSIQYFHKLGYIHNDAHSGNFLIHSVTQGGSWFFGPIEIQNIGRLLVIWDFDKSKEINKFSKIIWDYVWQFPEYLIIYQAFFGELNFYDIILDEWGRIINYANLGTDRYDKQYDFNKPYIVIISAIPFDESHFIHMAFNKNYNNMNKQLFTVYTPPSTKKTSFGSSFDKDICYLNNLKT